MVVGNLDPFTIISLLLVVLGFITLHLFNRNPVTFVAGAAVTISAFYFNSMALGFFGIALLGIPEHYALNNAKKLLGWIVILIAIVIGFFIDFKDDEIAIILSTIIFFIGFFIAELIVFEEDGSGWDFFGDD